MQASAIRRVRGRVAVLKALAHPVRVQLIEQLSRGERCVCEIHAIVGSDLTTVSKHLSVLKSAGLVSDERRGQQVFYTLLVPCLNSFVECVDAVVSRRLSEALEARGMTLEATKR
ncbi:MAG TPA: transcriptional regulator [Armatimonadetes bacterium]|nr:transcriptional regulator [Armatimonadota bacterium]